MNRLQRFAPGLWIAGCLLLLVGERFLADSSAMRPFLDPIGALLLLAVLVARGLETRSLEGDARRAAGRAFVHYALAALGLLLYPLATAAVSDRLGLQENGARSWRAFWTCAWLLLWWLGTVGALAADWARAGVRDARKIELGRVRAASAGALSFALAVAWVAALNYTAGEHDRLWEWSRSSRARASAATLELVAGLDKPVELVAFFPPANEVLRRIEPFLDEVSRAGTVKVEVLDQPMQPARAAELGARKNGVLFVVRGKDRERIDLDTDYDRAKRQLGELDRHFQEALLRVARSRATLYLTEGHGERGESASEDGAPGLRNAMDILRLLNVTTRSLSVTELISEPPDAAGLIGIFGPTRRFLPEEVASLVRFWERGGSLLVMLEPGSDHGLGELLTALGTKQLAGTVANDRYHLQRDGGPGDRRLVVTNRFGSHEVTSDLSRVSSEIGFLLDGASGLATVPGTSARTSVLIRPMAGSWLDRDGDFERDAAKETDEIPALALASTLTTSEGDEERESRAVVVGDVDAFADPFVVVSQFGSMSPNAKLLLDAYLWLARADDWEIPAVPGNDDPVLERTRAESLRWFLGSVFGVPALVFGCGLVYTRRRRARSRRAGGEA